MPPTRRGVYHNLKESKYTISNQEVVFFFSSKVYMRKFLNSYKDHRQKFFDLMAKIVVEQKLDMSMLADITLYEKIEKRGFRATLKGVEISCEDLHLYALRKMIERNTEDWCEIPAPKLRERLKTMESTLNQK